MTRRITIGLDHIPSPKHCQASLTQMQHGYVAAQILTEIFNVEGDVECPNVGVIYRLPTFLAGTNISVSWDVPVVGVVSGVDSLTAHWRAHDRATGELNGSVSISLTCLTDEGMAPVISRFASPPRLHRALRQIVTEGETASWALADDFRPYVASLVRHVSHKVSHELGVVTDETDRSGVIDEVEVEQVADTYLLGNGSERGLFFRLLYRAASDLGDQSKIGDRVTYVARNALRDVEDQLRRKIGDPHTGRLVRRVYHSLGQEVSFEELKAEFSRQHPKQAGLAAERTYASLMVTATPNMMSTSIDEYLEENGDNFMAGTL